MTRKRSTPIIALAGVGFALAAAASAFATLPAWATAALALCAGLDCAILGLSGGGRHDD